MGIVYQTPRHCSYQLLQTCGSAFETSGLGKESEGGRGTSEADGKAPSLAPAAKLASWARREVVLRPLVVLRGLTGVRIEGTVTNAWALYLESVTTGSEDGVMVEFLPQS
jgi:hypothetical protein